MSNIVDVVVADKNLATMLKSVKAAGLDVELGKKGPYTLFAPTDLAFGKLTSGKLPEWLKPENKTKLINILHAHMVEGKVNFRDLKDGQSLKMMNGQDARIRISGGTIAINGAKVQGRDNEASNGVVHSVDTVIQPN